MENKPRFRLNDSDAKSGRAEVLRQSKIRTKHEFNTDRSHYKGNCDCMITGGSDEEC